MVPNSLSWCFQTEGIGTVRSDDAIPAYEDDGLSSDEGSDDEDEDDEHDDDEGFPVRVERSPTRTPAPVTGTSAATPKAESVTVPGVNILAPSPIAGLPPTVVAPVPVSKTSLGAKIPRVFKKRPSLPTAPSTDSGVSSAPSATGTPSPAPSSLSRPSTPGTPSAVPPTSAKRSKFKRKWASRNKDYNLNAAHDILGIVMLEIKGATDLPKLKNSK